LNFRRNTTYLLILLITLTVCVSAQTQTLTGKVVAITDGDTFKLLLADSTLVKVRVANIDTPEKKQPYYQRAKEFTSRAIFSKQIRLEVLSKDRYGRSIALVFYDDHKNLSEELVTYGMAWHFVKYSKDQNLQVLEDLAKSKSIGLWELSNPIAPWDWRKGVRNE